MNDVLLARQANLLEQVGGEGEMGAALVDQEIISVAGSRFYTCMLHTDEIIDETIQKIDNICQKIE